jgi:hypothetical protein
MSAAGDVCMLHESITSVVTHLEKPFVAGVIILPNKNSATFLIMKYAYCVINHKAIQRP